MFIGLLILKNGVVLMNEKGIIEYMRGLYPEGCVVSMLVLQNEVKLLNSEIIQTGEK